MGRRGRDGLINDAEEWMTLLGSLPNPRVDPVVLAHEKLLCFQNAQGVQGGPVQIVQPGAVLVSPLGPRYVKVSFLLLFLNEAEQNNVVRILAICCIFLLILSPFPLKPAKFFPRQVMCSADSTKLPYCLTNPVCFCLFVTSALLWMRGF